MARTKEILGGVILLAVAWDNKRYLGLFLVPDGFIDDIDAGNEADGIGEPHGGDVVEYAAKTPQESAQG